MAWSPEGLATIGGLATTGISAALSRREARRQERFQLELANTQYQRAARDLRLAGINPILAGRLGGNAVPPGSAAQYGELQGGINTGLQGARASSELKTQRTQRQVNLAQKQQLEMATNKMVAEIEDLQAARKLKDAQRRNTAQLLPGLRNEAEIDKDPKYEWLRWLNRVTSSALGARQAIGK